MDFISISAGEFDMGSPIDEAYRGINEGQVHSVKISNAFYLGKYEVTQKQWRSSWESDDGFSARNNRGCSWISDAGSCRSATCGILWQINDNITSDKDIGFCLLRVS